MRMNRHRAAARICASLVAAFALACAAAPASAQTDPAAGYPNKPVRLIVGFAAGGGTDAMARIYAPKLSEILGQPVVIENRTGAGGRIAIEFVQSQPPDGYTLAFGAIGQLAIATAIYPNLPFHPTRTLIPVAMVSSYPMMLAAAAERPDQDRAGPHRLRQGQSGQVELSDGVADLHHLRPSCSS